MSCPQPFRALPYYLQTTWPYRRALLLPLCPDARRCRMCLHTCCTSSCRLQTAICPSPTQLCARAHWGSDGQQALPEDSQKHNPQPSLPFPPHPAWLRSSHPPWLQPHRQDSPEHKPSCFLYPSPSSLWWQVSPQPSSEASPRNEPPLAYCQHE